MKAHTFFECPAAEGFYITAGVVLLLCYGTLCCYCSRMDTLVSAKV